MKNTKTALLGVFTAAVLCTSPLAAGAQHFADEFDGSAIDASLWDVTRLPGNIDVSGGAATFQQGSSTVFPNLQARDAIPSTGNFAVEVGMQFLSATGHGSGVFVYDSAGFDPQLPQFWKRAMQVWGGYTSAPQQIWVGAGTTHEDVFTGVLSYHTYRFEFVDGEVTAWMDGNHVTGPNPSPRPDAIFVGNPHTTTGPADWSDFAIDYLRVQSLDNTAPDVSSAVPSVAALWPVNNKMVDVSIEGVTDADGDAVTIEIIDIQNEETGADDADGIGTDTAQLRAARDGKGDGRSYTITFVATDANGASAEGTVTVTVAHDQGKGNARGRAKPAGMATGSWGELKRTLQ